MFKYFTKFNKRQPNTHMDVKDDCPMCHVSERVVNQIKSMESQKPTKGCCK